MKSALTFSSCLAFLLTATGDVSLPRHIGSHMVLQRDQMIPLHGRADPGESVRVVFGDFDRETVADSSGRWTLTLDPVPHDPGRPAQSMTIQGRNRIILDDVVVGDVWLWAGEHCPPPADVGTRPESTEMPHPIPPRIFVTEATRGTPNTTSVEPVNPWRVAPAPRGDLPREAIEFGRALREHLEVPIGIVVALEGGTPIESWMSSAPRDQGRDTVPSSENTTNHPPATRPFESLIDLLRRIPIRGVVWDQGASDLTRAAEYETSLRELIGDWRRIWSDEALPFLVIQLRAGQRPGAAQSATLGENIPGASAHRNEIDRAAESVLREGQSEILNGWRLNPYEEKDTVRVHDGVVTMTPGQAMTGATWDGPIVRMDYEITLEARRLAGNDFFCGLTFPFGRDCCSLILGGWGGAVCGLSTIDHFDAANNETTRIIEFETGRWYSVRLRVEPNRIAAWLDGAPITDVTVGERQIDIRLEITPSVPLGVATYYTTGEFRKFDVTAPAPAAEPGADGADGAAAGAGTFPFRQLAVPRAGVAATWDLGPEPASDRIGRRLAHVAMARAYDQSNLFRPSPLFESASVSDDSVRIQFRHTDDLTSETEPIRGFELLAADGRWVPASATIENGTGLYPDAVWIRSPGVGHPRAARYGWNESEAGKPTLLRKDGMPVLPFRVLDLQVGVETRSR